ncbi:Acid phosphatase [Methylacidimicrobium sp. AP8]|uniref:acid phosphatase n=1 Tax=Methylacidimicrobium sp. AP8 TaxID=2730359 RepID=UPI0018C1231B|nr:acid phosphatase [Methylacidimicrobium sp. AP8]CAB4242984.1 Acid phosphatase [Methylacidimicrobium sp. AP8]
MLGRIPLLAAVAFGALAQRAPAAGPAPFPAPPIDHIILLYQENHSFDNLFGEYPGAEGIPKGGEAGVQVDRAGLPYKTLPPVQDHQVPDPRFPAHLPNRPFPLLSYVSLHDAIPDPVHSFYRNQLQIAGGVNSGYVAWGTTGALPMGYYATDRLPLYPIARQYTVLDHFFQAAFGGSFLNHIWLVAARTPSWAHPPADWVAEPVFDEEGRLIGLRRDGAVTPDGYVVGTVEGASAPHRPSTPPDRLLPPLAMPTIGDRLTEAGVSWAWYSGGWNEALAGRAPPTFQFHHQPFAYFARYGPGSPERALHLKDETDFLADLQSGRLPSVCFVKPLGAWSEHPGYADLEEGQKHAVALIRAIQASRYWPHCVVLLTYDEYGGFWDHVPPPRGDRWGPGTRIPAVLISPYAKKGGVDHRTYDTTSFLRFLEWRFGLPPLAERDAAAANLVEALRLP